jgi:26S proteasome regulatory subunit T2
MIELLARLDGFDARDQISIIFATNRLSQLDPALIRPGRIDRLIEVPLPDKASQIQIWKVHTRNMTLAKDVDVNKLFTDHERISGADVKAICTEAGISALRKHKPRSRIEVTMKDFEEAKNFLKRRIKASHEEGMYL